mmetsp:Transcript_27920/g.42269  ORF Transcript_27920/g.42269 Transcript_27920/m.42269 type:complete len:337 (+) Transcript_27920:166-1176(+)|eukprot:CAMPEP_0178919740 /NCGR_PEP_ID=MMETSP0786-20121207/14611_1 /TAXON_ID=186022 /ORGANISM="Thalassionema frauenfeldii, Strain CCMP 1798" /LENGTH=336 /DNA_ID=CAMNT_0020593717 /DNA_START=146 /DNA_END=1156 /DNA_ORIENTATION=+
MCNSSNEEQQLTRRQRLENYFYGEETTATPEPLNAKNYLNVVFFLINVVLTFGVGNAGWFGAATPGDMSDKYQTIVTPKGTAFSIWSVIFLSQGIFAAYQCLPRVRSHPLVQQGVGYWYCATCLVQSIWNFAFGFEQIVLALILIVSIWGTLVVIVYQQYTLVLQQQQQTQRPTLQQFWLLRFPFAIHCGWLTAASLLSINVTAVRFEASPSDQLAIGIISLAVLHAVSVWVVFGFAKPNYTIAGVLAWANGWISAELANPMAVIGERFGDVILDAVQSAALAVSLIIVGQVVVRLMIWWAIPSCAINHHHPRQQQQQQEHLTTTTKEATDEEQGK